MADPIIVAHGGTDSKPEDNDGIEAACRAGLQALDAGGDALDAAVAAVSVLELDGRYGAGVGAALGMDGRTIQLDAAVMDTRGRLGAVAGLEEVVHAVRVARAVADTPHVMLVGEGAKEFARRIGLHRPFGPNERTLREFREYVHKLEAAGRADRDANDTESDAGRALVRRFWNWTIPWDDVVREHGHGTVGVVVRDRDGHLAVAVTTSGSMPSLRGRVADIAQIGCGFYAGPHAAIACSGIGEHAVRHMVARTVHDWLAGGMPLQTALNRAIELIPAPMQSAVIAVTPDDAGVATRHPFAHRTLRG